MARPLRIELAGGFYHVISHGNGRLWLFRDDVDRKHFLRLLGKCVFKYRVTVHAFVLMTTHIHLLIETPMANLSQFMRKCLSDYGLYYNRRYRRRGSVFKTRYGSYLIQKDNYYLMIVRYLYNNPVKAGLVKNPEKYRWSSLYYLLHKRLVAKEIKWYKADSMMRLLGGKRGLIDLLAGGAAELPVVYQAFVGDKEWAEELIEENYDRISDEISGGKGMRKGIVDVERIIEYIAQAYKVSKRVVCVGECREARKLCLYYLCRYTPLEVQEVGEIFGMSRWAVSQVVHRMESGGLKAKERKIIQMLNKQMSHVKT